MYTVAVKTDFVAQHYLIGGDWGDENKKHSHHYIIELQLSGNTLDKHGYLVDIINIENSLEAIREYFKDKTLNELPEFIGLNPSIEHFSRIICEKLTSNIVEENIRATRVIVWENEIAWASFAIQTI